MTSKHLPFGLATALPLPFIVSPWNVAQAQQEPYRGWHMGPEMMGQWGMGGLGMIFMMAFWILLIVGLVFLIKWLVQATRGGRDTVHGSSRALEILKERYARSEIDKAEFDAKKRDLAT